MWKYRFKQLLSNWEKLIFAGSVLLLAAFGYVGFVGFGQQRPQPPARPVVQAQEILGESAFAFLEDRSERPVPTSDEADPFHFRPRRRLIVSVTPEPEPEPEPPAPEPEPEPEPPAPEPEPEPEPPRPTPPRTTPPRPAPVRTRILEYSGTMTTTSGTRLALVKDVNANRTFYLTANDAIEELQFEVVSFDSRELSLKKPDGETAVIPFAERKTFIIHE